MPTVEEVRKWVSARLVLSNPDYPRKNAVDRMTGVIYSWIKERGVRGAARLIKSFLSEQRTIPIGIVHAKDDTVCRDGRDQDESIRISLAGGLDEDRERNTGWGGLKVIEGGGDNRSDQGDQTTESPAGGTRQEPTADGISRRLVELELSEHQKDLKVFQKAYDNIKARVVSVQDEGRLMKLATWSGTTAVLGTLELVNHNIERVVGELKDILIRLDAGVISNLDEE